MKISPALSRWFAHYSAGYLRRHFHAVRMLRGHEPRARDAHPLIVCANHSSWWDPLVYLFLAREFFPARGSFGPMDAASLGRYGFLRRLGFFGVEPGTVRGARQFLRESGAILHDPRNMLWLTPQGRFCDVRALPVKFENGVGHLAHRLGRTTFLPLAIEYTFWAERLPEILVAFGEPVVICGGEQRPNESTALLEKHVTAAQNALAFAAQRREPDAWMILQKGDAGVSRYYDLWRRARARWSGVSFHPEHVPEPKHD